MGTNLAELRKTLENIAALDDRRKNLVQYRDRQIREVLQAGATWREVQQFTGLSARGLQKAVGRV